MSKDDRNSDHDLKAYLDGRDRVSAAYRETAQEEPPAALDQAILKAARKAAPEPDAMDYSMRRSYALAASVMIAVVGLSVYFGALDRVVPQRSGGQLEFFRLERAEAPAVAAEPAGQTAAAEVEESRFSTRQLAPPVPTVGVPESIARRGGTQDLSTEVLARAAATPTIAVINGPLLEGIEADADNARRIAAAGVSVTASRVTNPGARDLSYRESREDWLEEIRALATELDRLARLTGNTVYQERVLQEEMELFMAAHPDVDLEAELAE